MQNNPLIQDSGLYLLFQSSQQYFAVPIEFVVEVIKSQPLSTPPLLKRNLSGFLNLRGEVLPILQIQGLLSHFAEKSTYVVVSQINDIRFGFQVESVHQVISLDTGSLQIVDGITCWSENPLVSHFYQMEDKTVSILKLKEAIPA